MIRWLQVALLSLVLRGPLVVVAPLVHQIVSSGAVTAPWVGLSMGMTLFCFAAGAALVPRLSSRMTYQALIRLSLALCVAGIVGRSLGGGVGFVTGSLVIGVSIGFLNVVLPGYAASISGRSNSGPSAITFGLNMGAILSVLLVAGLGEYLDDWRWLLALPIVFIAVAFALPDVRAVSQPLVSSTLPPVRMRDLRGRGTMALIAVFMGVQAAGYYVFLTWMPFALVVDGVSQPVAGVVVAANQIGQMAVALAVASMLRRHEGRQPQVLAGSILVGGIGGLLVLTGSTPAILAGGALMGLGHGAALAMAFYLIVRKSGGGKVTDLVSVAAHIVGYLIGGFAPALAGMVSDNGAFLELLVLANGLVALVLLLLIRVLRKRALVVAGEPR